MMNRLLLLISFSAISGNLYAQQLEPSTDPRKIIEYIDANGVKVTSEKWADHRVETTYRDSVGGSVRVFYPSGKLRSYVPYLNIKRHIHHGVSSYYYESGQVRTQEDYVGGKLHGKRLTYYPDGKPKRKESYEKGEFVSGECYGPDGAQVAFFPYDIMPIYSEGATKTL